jgi:DNA-binding transcriptional LysR family regulator
MEDRSVTRAATRLKVQQPAMSHSLATLRVLMQDKLFNRTGPAMQPTARAMGLAPRIRDALRQVQETLRHQDGFDRKMQDRTLRLGFSSEPELLVMPDLTAQLRRCAPNIRLLGRAASRDDVHGLLDDGLLDLGIGCFDHGNTRHRAALLFEQSLSCCFNPSLLRVQPPIDVQTYVATPHALVTFKDSLQGCLSEALERIDTRLNVVTAALDFFTVMSAAAQAPVLATLPTRMARRYAAGFGLVVSPVSLELRLPAVSMV